MQNEEKGVKHDIKSMLPEEIADALSELGAPKFRGDQIFRWLHGGITSFESMTNLPKKLRNELSERFTITAPVILDKKTSASDGTVKYLWELFDGNTVETVYMVYNHGNTVCVSSQAGCRMGCAFCASTIGGLERNLLPSEILDQVILTELDMQQQISNIVIMGIGEPLDNFGNVLRFLELVTHPKGRNIGMRHITLSTCGLTERIDKLGDYNLQLTLSVSLHAPDDETRSRIMPVNNKYSVETLFKSCAGYFAKTGRRVTFEYAMIDGINDTDRHGMMLADRLRQFPAHVNLIPLNEVRERELRPSSPERIKAFKKLLESQGVNVTVRRSLGTDVTAACGQLRRMKVFEDI